MLRSGSKEARNTDRSWKRKGSNEKDSAKGKIITKSIVSPKLFTDLLPD